MYLITTEVIHSYLYFNSIVGIYLIQMQVKYIFCMALQTREPQYYCDSCRLHRWTTFKHKPAYFDYQSLQVYNIIHNVTKIKFRKMCGRQLAIQSGHE